MQVFCSPPSAYSPTVRAAFSTPAMSSSSRVFRQPPISARCRDGPTGRTPEKEGVPRVSIMARAAVVSGIFQEEFVLEPSPRAVLNNIIPDTIMGYIYGALVESFCSEQNARMMAMEAANKSGADMLHNLSVQYNRVRQAQITQEITEVIAGAKAQKRKKKQKAGKEA